MSERSTQFPPACSNNEARDCFWKSGLTYEDVTTGDILALVMMLNEEIKKSNKAGETSVNTMRLSSKIIKKCRSNGTITECYLLLNSHYFRQRECISFNRDGFIGFAGWADDQNLNPIKRAFIRWCKELSKVKGDQHEGNISGNDDACGDG